jgi:hypothetical protein
MHLNFMNVILLYSDHQHVSFTHVTIFRVASAKNRNTFIVCQVHSKAKIR